MVRSVSSANLRVERRRDWALVGVKVDGEREVMMGMGRWFDFGARGMSLERRWTVSSVRVPEPACRKAWCGWGQMYGVAWSWLFD